MGLLEYMLANKYLIRLACISCDREDCDGVLAVPDGWIDVHRVQTYAQSAAPCLRGDERIFDWYTHLGTCPDCRNYAESNAGEPRAFA